MIRQPARYFTVPAFTLMEVVVVMMLTAILVGMSYSLFEIIHREYARYEVREKASTELMSLGRTLTQDLEKAERVTYQPDSAQLNFTVLRGTMDSTVVRYRFEQRGVVRLTNETDTLYTGLSALGNIKPAGSSTSLIQNREDGGTSSSQAIACFSVTVGAAPQAFTFSYYKAYAATEFMNGSSDTEALR